ncbi:MAG: transglutaminase domain-containing protein [Planctomycetota bacterium]
MSVSAPAHPHAAHAERGATRLVRGVLSGPARTSAHLVAVAATALGLVVPGVPRALPALVALPVLVRALRRRGADGPLLAGRWGPRLAAALAPVLVLGALHVLRDVPERAYATLLVLLGVAQIGLLVRTPRPTAAYLVLFLAAVQVVASVAAWPGALGLLVVLAFASALGWTVLLLERDPATVRGREVPGVRRLVAEGAAPGLRPLAGFALRFLVVALPLTLLLYALAPRGLATWVREVATAETGPSPFAEEDARVGSREGGRTGVTGPDLRDNADAAVVPFGGVARIQASARPFFEVRLLDEIGAPRDVVLRENALSQVASDGSWRAPEALVRDPLLYRANAAGEVVVDERPGPGTPRRLSIEVLQGGHRRLFLEEQVLDVSIHRAGRTITREGVRRRDDGTWTAARRVEAGDEIRQTSRPLPRDTPWLGGRRSDAAVSPLRAWLQLPDDLRAEVLPLAREVVGSEMDPWLRAQRLEAWLRGPEFVYSLAQPPLDPSRRVADFLFRVRQGHCECYATSLVVLLRSLGHPARYVRGFWGGDATSDERRSLVMRGTHYHAWAEIYLDGAGWVPLNPTPPDRRAVDAQTHTVEVQGGRGEAPWFDLDREGWTGLWTSVAKRGERLLALLFGPQSAWAGVPLVVLLALVALRLARRRSGRRAPATKAAGPTGPYAEMLALLRARGVRRAPSATPRELETQAATRHPRAARSLRRLTAWEEHVRYGGGHWPAEVRSELQALADALTPTAPEQAGS